MKENMDGYWDQAHDCWVFWVEPITGAAPPAKVKQVPCLKDDLESLKELLSADKTPVRYVRALSIQTVVYSFGDASGSGFGTTFYTERGIAYWHGVWGKDADSDTSNFRELANLVDALEEGMKDKTLLNAEVFIFMDNTTAELAFYKGNTKSKTLFALILRLRHLDMDGAIKMHFNSRGWHQDDEARYGWAFQR